MKIELSKKWKIITYSAIAVTAFAVGLFLECCDKKEFVITSVPSSAEKPEPEEYDSHYDKDGKRDSNVATIGELDKLHGIGEKMATRIIEYRKEHGIFMAIEELTLVNGIGESLIEQIQDDICVRIAEGNNG